MSSSRRHVWLMAIGLSVGVASAGLLASTGCIEPEPPTRQVDCGVGQPVVDPALLAFLSKAKSAHATADLAAEDEDHRSAIAALEGLVNGPRPGGANPGAEAREVVADALARLADLRSAEGEFTAAMKDVDQGLALAKERTHFRGRLMEVRGVVQQRHHKQLADSGQPQAAAKAKASAIESFQMAIEIQDEVIQRALDDPSRSP